MADLRELIILSPEVLYGKGETPLRRALGGVRMALRRAVIASSRIGLVRRLQVAMYNAHFSAAAALGKRFAGTRAVYGGGGVTAGDLYVGISDIDIAIFGDWPEERQFTLLKMFGLLTVLSPLYDRGCMVNICTVEDLHWMSSSDMLLAMMYARGRTQWRLMYGEDVFAELPEITPERFSGCVMMELRRWWSTMTSTTFGSGIMGRDPIFRNSACFKVVAEMLRAESMAAGELNRTPRRALIEQELAEKGDESGLLRRLLENADGGFLDRTHDPRPETMHWLLPRMERFHAAIAAAPSFAVGLPMQVDALAEERLIAPETMQHCRSVVDAARQGWPALRGAYLIPSLTMMPPDGLALLLEPEADTIPNVAMLRPVCALHLRTRDELPQRVRLYLLLSEGAYFLDVGEGLDIFQFTLTPSATPDVFGTLADEGFSLFGERRPLKGELRWTPFAAEVAAEELHARRGAFARFGVLSRPRLIDNLRNFWRYLQLLAVEETAHEGSVTLPTTLPAVARTVGRWQPSLQADLDVLLHVFEETLLAKPVDDSQAGPLMQRVYEHLAAASKNLAANSTVQG